MTNKRNHKELTVCLFVEHRCPEVRHSIYIIKPPPNLSEYEEKLIDSHGFMAESVSPLLTFPDKVFLTGSAMFNLGSRIYFFGGVHNRGEFNTTVRFLDTLHPRQGLEYAARMNAPKEFPCVFADEDEGMIYTLGSTNSCKWRSEWSKTDWKGTGCFERYDPQSNEWEVLPDPPLPPGLSYVHPWCDCATVVDGRFVFIGNTDLFVIFNLDTKQWEPPLTGNHRLAAAAARFPYGSLCVNGSLYYLRGQGVRKPGTFYDPARCSFPPTAELVKRGPLLGITNKDGKNTIVDPSRLLLSQCLRPDKDPQVMATDRELDGGAFFTHSGFRPWREIFHLGGRFFCYVFTTQLFNESNLTCSDPYCRCVWIKVFEEVQAENGINKTVFRPLASFCYKIRTPFLNNGFFVRCCVLGTVPNSWVKAPMRKTHVVTEFNAEGKSQHEHEAVNRTRGQEGDSEDLKKTIADLKALLAKKEAALNALMAKSE